MRRKPLGAIAAWGSLAIFTVLTIMGIAGLVMGLQPHGTAAPVTGVKAAAVLPAAGPADDRLPQELSFADAQAAGETAVAAPPQAEVQVAAVAETTAVAAPAADTDLQVAARRDDLIASTFEQLVKPVVVPASDVPDDAVATVEVNKDTAPVAPAPAETAVASIEVELPLAKEDAAAIAMRPRTGVNRNAAAWAIESEVPEDEAAAGPALGYAAQPADEEVRVGDSSVNVRSGPSQDNKRLFALAAGAEVDVDGKSDGWVAITDSRGREGWVDASLLDNLDLEAVPAAEDVPEAEPEKPSNLKTVGGSGVTVRAGPGKSNKQLFALINGSEVSVIDESKGWLKIKDAKGRTGWAYKDFLN